MEWDWLEAAYNLQKSGKPYVLVTVIGEKGSTPRDRGAKMIVTADGSILGTIGGGQFEMQVKKDALAFLDQAKKARGQYPLCLRAGQCCGGAAEVFFELIGVKQELVIFGAGHVAQALCSVMVGTPFHISLVDNRVEWVHHPELPKSVSRYDGDWRAEISRLPFDCNRTWVLIMTHEHQLDLEILTAVLQLPTRWVGLIGSQHKRERFVQKLRNEGMSDAAIERFICPIGDFKFGKSPKEIAISVAAQLLRLASES